MRRNWKGLLVVATAACLITGLAPAGAESLPTVTTARLRIEITTSSDWARVRLEGLTFPASRTLETSTLAPVTFSGDAWTVVNHTAGTTRFVVDTVAREPTGRPELRVVVEQGRFGTTTASVVDPARGAVLTEATGGAAAITVARTLTRAELLGTTELELPHGDPRRLVLAAYYPWFDRSGDRSEDMAEEPAQPRSAWILDDVRSHASQARAAGIDGFAVSWAGARHNGAQLDLVLQAMSEQGGVVVPYLETAEARGLLGRVDKATVASWLDEALSRAGSPAFLRAPDGVPMVMVFEMEQLSADAWASIAADSAARGRPVRLVGDADPGAYGQVTGGWHRYGAWGPSSHLASLWRTMAARVRGAHLLDPSVPAEVSVATVSPGYDDTNLRGSTNDVIHRGPNGERYAETWDAAVAADPDWILITSWNEWFEGTSVEPGTESGDLALRQTAERSTAWRGAPLPSVPSTPTTTTTPAEPAPEPPRHRLPFLPWSWPGPAAA